MTLRLYLIRHGETEWSRSGQHTGRTDVPLTACGEDEARELMPWLRHIRFAHVFISPLQRAGRTCELAAPGAAAEVEPDLAEWDYGDYEGRLSRDIHRERPGWNVFRDGCPNGELAQQVSDRADRLIARLCTLDGNVALFSHGQFSRALAARWIESLIVLSQHFSLDTAALSVLGFDPGHPEMRVIELWNAAPAALAGGSLS
jgi:broad specificity phosphatase PhoE